jgi:hypothetical protein
VSLIRSLHMQHVQVFVEDCNDLMRAIELEEERSQGRSLPKTVEFKPAALMYRDYVRFVDQLRRYEEHFPRERIHVIVYNDLLADNVAVVRGILNFIGVDDRFAIEPAKANPSVRIRSQRLHSVSHAVTVGRTPGTRPVQRVIKAVTPQTLRHKALRRVRRQVSVAPGAADPQVVQRLRELFVGEVVALSEYLERDLVSEWDYRDLI